MLWRILSRYSQKEFRLMTTAGRPTSFEPEYCELAYNYCLLGATNEQLGSSLGVTRRTIFNSIEAHPDFALKVMAGRGLFSHAVGFEHTVKLTVRHEGEERTLSDTRYYPPESKACIHWLNNRQPEIWRCPAMEPRPERGPDIEALEAGAREAAHQAAD
jgi:hypothetical protein